MCWPWRAPALGDGQHGHHRRATTERNSASEYLYRYETMVGQSSAHNRSSTAYLNHDHRESENIRFPAMRPLVQDLWRGPPHSVTMLMRGTLYGVWVLSDRSEAKVRETCMIRVVHKDVWLHVCQYSGRIRFRTTAYTLEVPMNNIAGVEVVEALSNVG
jgi:hypothetical protein